MYAVRFGYVLNLKMLVPNCVEFEESDFLWTNTWHDERERERGRESESESESGVQGIVVIRVKQALVGD